FDESEYLEAVQTVTDWIRQLPIAESGPLLAELQAVRRPAFLIRTVPHEMKFDTPRITVEAGSRFRLILENPDAMPHNLVIVKPGMRERVGLAAAQMLPEKLDARGRAYVPDLPEIFAATKLLEPGQSEILRLVAPLEPGVYEYV